MVCCGSEAFEFFFVFGRGGGAGGGGGGGVGGGAGVGGGGVGGGGGGGREECSDHGETRREVEWEELPFVEEFVGCGGGFARGDGDCEFEFRRGRG